MLKKQDEVLFNFNPINCTRSEFNNDFAEKNLIFCYFQRRKILDTILKPNEQNTKIKETL